MHILLEILPEVFVVFLLTAFVFVGMIHSPYLSFYSGLCFGILGATLEQRVYGVDLRPVALSFLPLLCLVAILTRPRQGRPDAIRTFAIWGLHILLVVFVYLLISRRRDIESLVTIAFIVALGFYLPIHLLRLFSPVTRANRHYRLCRTLRDAVAMQVPLSPMLDAAAKNAAGREARVLRRLAYRIDHGMPFGGAILTRYKDCPPRARGPILAAEEMNRLQDGLDEACRRLRRKAHVDRNHPSLSGVAYLLMLILAVVTGMAVFLVPMFHEILDGSGAEFPAKYNWTRLTVMMLATRGNELFAAVLAALGLALTLEKLWPGVLLRNWPFSAIHDFVAWWVPPFKSIHRIEQERALIHHLQSGLAGEQDLVRILDAAQRLELNRYLSRRVKLWRQAVQEGGDPHKAALASGIRPSIARVFASSQSPLRMCLIAEACLKQIQAQLDHRRDVVYATVLPFFIIGCGLIVSAIGLCFIAPLAVLTKMIL